MSSKGNDNSRDDSAVELAAFVLGSQRIAYGGVRRVKPTSAGLQVVFATGISVVVPYDSLHEYISFQGTFAEFKQTSRGYFHVISILSSLYRVLDS